MLDSCLYHDIIGYNKCLEMSFYAVCQFQCGFDSFNAGQFLSGFEAISTLDCQFKCGVVRFYAGLVQFLRWFCQFLRGFVNFIAGLL